MTAQQLKNSILQLAVQGKLVPQDPTDEPASVLLERIRAEKEKLIKEGKIKKEKTPSVIFRGADNTPYEKVVNADPVSIADEVPFDIPDSWEWVRFKNLVYYNMGKTPPRKEIEYWENATFPWVSIADLVGDGIVNTTKECVNDYAVNNTFRGKISKAGTLLMSFKLTVGKVSILGIDAFHNEAIISIYPFIDENRITTKYLFKILPLMSQSGDTKTAIKGNTLNSDSLDSLFIPLPPLNEQKRISDKIDELKNPLLFYEKSENEAIMLDLQFPEQLKKSILQMAVQGKLVQQDENDEPARVLLERIRAEKQRLIKEGKIKKDKSESVIFRRDNSHYEKLNGKEICIDDEIPFEIPETWAWTRWGSLSYSIQYGYNTPALESGRIKMVRISDIQNNTVLWKSVPYCEIKESEIPDYSLEPNDILFARTGGTVGKSFLVSTVPEPSIYAGYLIRTRYSKELCPQYLKFFMGSPLYWIQLKEGTTATAQPNCNGKTLGKMLIPIPPQHEQIRIVEAIQRAFDLVDTL